MSAASSRLARREVLPEILDDLPENDPRAVASRGDLRRVNALMFQAGITRGLLTRHLAAPPRRILEIGAGDGSLMLALARRLHTRWPAVDLFLLDRQSLVTPARIAEFAALGWTVHVVEADIFAWSRQASAERFDAITTNLFLHHFEDEPLSELLGDLAPMAPVFVATEPRRAAFPLFAASLLWCIGANDVTRHDAAVSVRAGFAGGELSSLWPARPSGTLEEGPRGLFTHAFAAVSTTTAP
jgi:2-polyprenyl-3-methyl-5-hydroxy-6-metoxy-1,4-benzoquinol methylase